MGRTATQMLPTADGRELEVLVSGPEDGFPLVFFPWTPAAAVPFGLLERAAAERGLRMVSYSRPGYGRSTPRLDAHTTAQVADDAADTAAILDLLGLGEFVTIAFRRRAARVRLRGHAARPLSRRGLARESRAA